MEDSRVTREGKYGGGRSRAGGAKGERVGYISKTQTQMSAKALRLLRTKAVGSSAGTLTTLDNQNFYPTMTDGTLVGR